MKSDGSLAWDRAVGTAEGGALRGFVPGLGGRAFVIAASARTDGGTRYIYVWLGQTDAQAALTTRVELPWGIPDVFTMFGRTADGGLYMAANYLDPPPPPYVYNYRVLKIGPAPIAASTDHAELLSLVDLQGEISREGFLTGLVGIGGLTYVTEYSTDLRTWLPLATNTVATTDVKVRDLGAATSPHRFYRARLLE
jgi:hypothetical protein